MLPAILCAISYREWKIAAVAAVFAVLNPLLFSPPETDDAWMTRVVLAERWWNERDRGFVGLAYPNVLNAVNVPVTLSAIVAASPATASNCTRRNRVDASQILVRRRTRPRVRLRDRPLVPSRRAR